MIPLLPTDWDIFRLALTALVGLVVGFIGGLVGLVLGILRLPVVYGIEVSPSVAAGTNIGVSAMTAITGSVRHLREGRVDKDLFLFMGVSSFIGAFIGGYFSRLVPSWILLGMVGTVLVYSGITMTFPKKSDLGNAKSPMARVTRTRILLEIILGFTIGVLGAMVGLVLGSLRLPAMIKMLGVQPQKAAGTNLAIGLFTGISGVIGHLIHGDVDFPVLLVMGSAAMVGSYQGAHYTGKVDPETLKRIIGAVLLVLAVTMFLQAYFRF